MDMLNISMYTQMGFPEKLVHQAHKYSRQNNVDMFEALQQIQKNSQKNGQHKNQTPPSFSYFSLVKNLNVSDYEVIFGKSTRNHHLDREQIREKQTPVGILNISNCCYLNSLIQCYFLMGSFVRQVLSAEPLIDPPQFHKDKIMEKKIRNSYALLDSLKQTLARLKLTSKKYINPELILKSLVNQMGQKIQYGDEKDLQQTHINIIQRISQCLKFTKKYHKEPKEQLLDDQKYRIKKLFYGQKVQYTTDTEHKLQSDFMGIIINPASFNIMTAIDSEFNYEVEIDSKKVSKKIFLKTVPDYLFFNISRNQEQKEKKKIMKVNEKMTFDFVIYLDRYMDKNRQNEEVMNENVIALRNKQNQIGKQLYHLKMLTAKLAQCREHTEFLSGLVDKLPQQEQLKKQEQLLIEENNKIEEELDKIQFRNQKYVLLYLFVYRGDATTGHYWGYGRNGNDWYRFDTNCMKLKQEEILIDMEKSGGIAYTLVYTKENNIQSFNYPYYLSLGEGEMQLEEQKNYLSYISQGLKRMIILENEEMYEYFEKKKIQIQIEKLIKEYISRCNLTMSYCQSNRTGLPLYNNFACFLHNQGERDLMKYNIFASALLEICSIKEEEIMSHQEIMKKIEKNFKKKVKGKMFLRYFTMKNNSEKSQQYLEYSKKYHSGKKSLNFINFLFENINEWPKIPEISKKLFEMCEILKESDESYIKKMVQELIPVIILDLGRNGEKVYSQWLEPFATKFPLFKKLLTILNIQLANCDQQKEKEEKIEENIEWFAEDLKKVQKENELIEKVKNIIEKVNESYNIFRKNLKQKEVVEELI